MKYIQYEFKELFLELVLTSYFDKNNDNIKLVINYDVIEPIIKEFLTHFYSYDLAHKTTHIALIKQMFITREVNRQTCEKLGYCKRTFYRYRKQYLQTFEIYLSRRIEISNLFDFLQ